MKSEIRSPNLAAGTEIPQPRFSCFLWPHHFAHHDFAVSFRHAWLLVGQKGKMMVGQMMGPTEAREPGLTYLGSGRQVRISSFGFVSDFGFRISDFRSQ
jgi:hypothetical protein